ncbi:MAG TPA: cupin domain-containing protein [Actinomycetota bacterium]|nr:cupin domain-containing protein [Actinomycetota bacterium]
MSAEPPEPSSAGSTTPQSFSFDPTTLELEPAPLDPSQVVRGDPQVAERVMWSSPDGRRHRGVWEHTAGVSTDVEVDEVFVVVSGRATIEVEGGPTLDVGPGDVGILEAGARTTWRVHETLRKVFHVDVPDADGD